MRGAQKPGLPLDLQILGGKQLTLRQILIYVTDSPPGPLLNNATARPVDVLPRPATLLTSAAVSGGFSFSRIPKPDQFSCALCTDIKVK
jgi:hypothetical protein